MNPIRVCECLFGHMPAYVSYAADQLSNSAGVVVKDLDDGGSRSYAANDDDDHESDKYGIL